MGKPRRIAFVTNPAPPSPKRPTLATAGASLIGVTLALADPRLGRPALRHRARLTRTRARPRR